MDDDALTAALAKLEQDGAGPEVRAAFERRFAQLQDPQAGLLHGDDLEPLTDADVPHLDDLDAGDPQAILDRVVVIKLNGGLGTSMGLTGPKALIDVNTGRTKDDGWLAALRDLSVSGTKGDVLEAYMASWTGTDLSKRVEGTNTPMLALLGELDPGASADRTKASVGSWFSKLDIVPLPETGHYPMYERPREFVDLVTRAVTHS